MPSNTVFSKLDAVNIILKCIGEDPVSSLSSGLPDAEAAEAVYDETMRDVLESGWHCNTEKETTLTLDSDSKIPLPDNCLKVDTSGDDADIDVTERDGFLYNLTDKTFTFDDDVVVDIVYLLEFTELPYRLAHYIAWVAGGKYQMRQIGSNVLEGWIEKEINDSLAKLNASEEASDDANVLRDSRSVALAAYRNNYIRGQ